MKYYSDKTKKIYDTEEALVEAEKVEAKKQEKVEALKLERTNRAKEIESAYKDAVTAYNKYNELVNKFIDDYGSFHMTFNQHGNPMKSIFDMFFGW